MQCTKRTPLKANLLLNRKLLSVNDRLLWDDFRGGSEEAFAKIYHQYSVILYQYGFRFTFSQSLIEDSIQDLFVDLVRSRKSLGETDNIKLYLLKSFRRKLVRALKKEFRYSEEFISELQFGVHLSREDELIQHEARHDILKNLAKALEQISPRQREAIYLRFRKELDYPEVAQVMDMSLEACRNLIYRAVKTIRQYLDKEESASTLLFIFRNFKKI